MATTTTAIPGKKSGMAEPPTPTQRRPRPRLRALLRVLHRDIGYLIVGLTIVYALSGLAVNHVGDWDPNFTQIDREHRLELPLPAQDEAAAAQILEQLGRRERPKEVYRASEDQLDIVLEHSTLHVEPKTGVVHEEGQAPRPLLRAINWLHLNRGKKAWTFVADAYAVLLLFLATSGLFMIPGRKGLIGRGALLAGLGALIPILYVTLSGGP